MLASSALCCASLQERQCWQKYSYPLQGIQTHFYFSNGELNLSLGQVDFYKVSLIFTQTSIFQVFPNLGQAGWGWCVGFC